MEENKDNDQNLSVIEQNQDYSITDASYALSSFSKKIGQEILEYHRYKGIYRPLLDFENENIFSEISLIRNIPISSNNTLYNRYYTKVSNTLKYYNSIRNLPLYFILKNSKKVVFTFEWIISYEELERYKILKKIENLRKNKNLNLEYFYEKVENKKEIIFKENESKRFKISKNGYFKDKKMCKNNGISYGMENFKDEKIFVNNGISYGVENFNDKKMCKNSGISYEKQKFNSKFLFLIEEKSKFIKQVWQEQKRSTKCISDSILLFFLGNRNLHKKFINRSHSNSFIQSFFVQKTCEEVCVKKEDKPQNVFKKMVSMFEILKHARSKSSFSYPVPKKLPVVHLSHTVAISQIDPSLEKLRSPTEIYEFLKNRKKQETKSPGYINKSPNGCIDYGYKRM
ncbi:hypothetical protein CWI39_1567p0020 [Hamiltosporidium magnivora]|uniref:Uncharacterized protein n=1 Tax=Hamiltosporidium magnivora TaxID=148818 RepID=A0A4V2JUM5_9MICR|nr:hypothetical protein CWI39_1567p0020 [Hamiltosporidium magnivora]